MEEQVKQPQESVSGDQVESGIDYISAINEIKANSVSRDAYEKLKKENKELLDSLINGGQVAVETSGETESIEEMRKGLYAPEVVEKGMTNLEYIEKTLKLRDKIIESGGIDPFLPIGKGVQVSRDDIDQAEQVAEVFRECVEYANGNSEVFTNELMRRTVDTGLPKRQNSNYYRR